MAREMDEKDLFPDNLIASLGEDERRKLDTRRCDDALYLMGGRGYLKGCGVERMHRDAKVTEIYEGTSDVQRMVLALDMMASV